jgi:hypothetical protein
MDSFPCICERAITKRDFCQLCAAIGCELLCSAVPEDIVEGGIIIGGKSLRFHIYAPIALHGCVISRQFMRGPYLPSGNVARKWRDSCDVLFATGTLIKLIPFHRRGQDSGAWAQSEMDAILRVFAHFGMCAASEKDLATIYECKKPVGISDVDVGND